MSTLNTEECAKLLSVSKSHLERLARSKEIPAMKPGRSWVFIEEDVLEWMRSKYRRKIGRPRNPLPM